MLSNIVGALENVLAYVEKQSPKSYELSEMLHAAMEKRPDAPTSIGELLEILATTQELHIFKGMMVTPGMAVRFDHASLAMWLILGAQRKGLAAIVHDLETYVSTDEVPILWVSAVQGINLHKKLVISEGMFLLPWEELPESENKQMVFRSLLTRARHPSALLIHPLSLQRAQIHSESSSEHPFMKIRFDDRDALLCIGLYGPSAPIIAASWIEIPELMPSWVSMAVETCTFLADENCTLRPLSDEP